MPDSEISLPRVDFIIPPSRQSYFPAFLSKVWNVMFGSVKAVMHRMVYGNQANLGSDNAFFYDTKEKKWKSRVEPSSSSQSGTPTNAIAGPPIHMPHPHCVSRHFPKATIDMSGLSHPVYAPSGSMIAALGSASPPRHGDPGSISVRSSPFS